MTKQANVRLFSMTMHAEKSDRSRVENVLSIWQILRPCSATLQLTDELGRVLMVERVGLLENISFFLFLLL